LKSAGKVGEVTGINLVDETSELMVISRFGKIIRIDTKSIRAAGRSTQGIKLLDLEPRNRRRTYHTGSLLSGWWSRIRRL
jgi:DNA gyrase subunit A